MRPRVKICGLTRAEDVALAVALGADALGFVFAPSKRQVSPEAVSVLTAGLPGDVWRVGVFGPAERHEAAAVAARCGLDTLQFHGEPDLGLLASLRGRYRVVQAVGVGEESVAALQARLEAIAPHVDVLLLDTARPGQLGGTGERFDWAVLRQVRVAVPVVVAGGLAAENVGELIATAVPWGVDVASGTEAAPGIKDPARLRAFFAAAHQPSPLGGTEA